MNTAQTYSNSWQSDLEASRDVSQSDKKGFQIVLSWFEKWRIKAGLEPGRPAAKQFWREQVVAKKREPWQLQQWTEAMRWYLVWLRHCVESGGSGMSVSERVKRAVNQTAARRGLRLQTRRAYGGWCRRYAAWVGECAEKVVDESWARDFLSHLVTEERVAYSTQKQALNALVFFFREVCGREEIDLKVEFRRTEKRPPVVLDFSEIAAILDNLPPTCRLAAELQYGSGVRLSELINLRIKDVDTKRGQLTVRSGKGDKDRVTLLPEIVAEQLGDWKEEIKLIHQRDRLAGTPGVALPTALGRKWPKAGEKWHWFWLFPAPKLSTDPDSRIVRRHHLHRETYGRALRKAADAAGIEKHFTSHVLRQ